MNTATGTLTLKPVMAEVKKDNDHLTKQDPYCLIFFGSQKFKSNTCRGGGRKPTWTDVFTMKRTSEDMIRIQLWDKDYISRDDFIGEGVVAFSSLVGSGKCTNWVELSDKGRPAGKILLESDFKSDYVKPTMSQGYDQQSYNQSYGTQQQQYYPNQQQQQCYPTQQQQSYPTQQQSYPTQQQSYPTQQQSYSTQQQSYPVDKGFMGQQGYPMQQQTFPSQQYPTQQLQKGLPTQQGYPTQQQQGYPMQQQTYPMQQQTYPSQQGGYNQQGYYGQPNKF